MSPAVAESSTLRNISTPVTVVVAGDAAVADDVHLPSLPRTVPASTRPVTTVPRPLDRRRCPRPASGRSRRRTGPPVAPAVSGRRTGRAGGVAPRPAVASTLRSSFFLTARAPITLFALRSAGRRSGSMPSSSATCSTTTVSTSASRSARVSQRCSIGRRNSTSRVGVAAAAAHQRRQRHRAARPSRRGSAGCPRRRTRPGRAGPASARRCRSTMPSDQVVEPLARGAAARAARGCRGSTAGPRIPRPRRSRGRRVGRRGSGLDVVHAASLIGTGPVGGYRLPRESCPPLFAHRLRPSRGHHAHLRLRRPDRRPRPAGDLRRAARLRPVRRAQRAALGPARLGGAAAGARTRRRAARPTTTCSRSPTPSARPPARSRRRRAAAGRRRPARETGRAAATCGCCTRATARRSSRPGHGARVARHGRPLDAARPRRAVFKAYDVRGTVPDQIDEDLARATGRRLRRRSPARRPSSSATTCGPARPGWPRAFADGRRRGRRRRRDDRAGLDRPALLRLRPPRPCPARCSPPATTRRSTTASRCAAPSAAPIGMETGLAEIRDLVGRRRRPTAARPGAITERDVLDGVRRPPARAGAGRRAAGSRSSSTPATGWPGTPRRPCFGRLARRGRAGADVLRARRHLPEPRGQPDRAGEPARPPGPGRRARAPTSGWPSTATPTAASSSTSAATPVSPSTLTALIADPRAGQGAGRDGDPQPDHQPRRARRSSPSSAASRSAPGSATPSSRRRWPRPTRSSAASTAATSTSATSGAPTPGCSPRCTRWPRSPRPTVPLSELLADVRPLRRSAARSTPTVADRRR